MLCSDLAFAVAAGFRCGGGGGGVVLDSLEISVPCIACELVLLNLIEFCH